MKLKWVAIFTILSSLTGSFASADGTVKTLNGHEYNPENVYYRGTTGLNLVGLADLKKLKTLLAPMGYDPVEFAPGQGAVNVVFLDHKDVTGCTCPSSFTEYYIGVLIKPRIKGSEKSFNVVRLFEGSNHVVRRAVMLQKFATNSQLADVKFNYREKTAQILLPDGQKVMELRVKSDMTPEGNTAADVVFYTPGAKVGATKLKRSFYRFLSMGTSVKGQFNPQVDKLTLYESKTELGKISQFLNRVGFTPIQPEFYHSIDIDQARLKSLNF
ncbi:MAG: hypothetical protein AB1540_14185 [Bdellovibrionota bacterium]